MNSNQLHAAIHSIQMLTMLQKAVSSDKDMEVSLSRIRAYIERSVVDSVIDKSDSQYISKISIALEEILTDKNFPLDFKKIIDCVLSKNQHTSLYQLQIEEASNKSVKVRGRSSSSLTTMFKIYLNTLTLFFPLSAKMHMPEAQAAKKFSTFASVVRNSDWLYVLTIAGLKNSDIVKFNSELTSKYSSRQGLTEMPGKFLELSTSESPVLQCVKAKKGSVKNVNVCDLYDVYVSVKPNSLITLPEVTKLISDISTTQDNTELNKTLADLLSKYSSQVKVLDEQSTEIVAKDHMTKFLEEVKALALQIKKIKVGQAKEASAFKREKALKALRGLDAATLKAIRENPELLSEI